MSRNSSGTYTQPNGTAAVSGATIDPTAFNTLISDLGNELTNSLDRSGRGAMTAPLNFGGFKGTNAADPASAQDLATKNYVDTNSANLKSANNLSDLANAAMARGNLGLTSAATASIGTGSGTVAAGDDSRFYSLPNRDTTAADALVTGDAGKIIWNTTGGVTVPTGLTTNGIYTITNESDTAITITQGSGLTMYLQGSAATSGNRTLAARGSATITVRNSTTAYIAGNIS